MDWHFHLTLGLNRNQPSATRQAHRDVLDSTQHFPAVTISHPAKFGKQDAVVVLFQTGPLRIAKAGMLFLLLEPPFIRFLFAAACKSHSTRLWLQYQFLEIQFLRCREGIEYSRHRAVHPRHQCRGFSRWIGKQCLEFAGPGFVLRSPRGWSQKVLRNLLLATLFMWAAKGIIPAQC